MSETSKEAAEQLPETSEVFEELLNESLDLVERLQGQVVKGTVLSIENDLVLVDVGLKSEGHIPAREFGSQDEINNLTAGDKLDVFVERFEGRDGVVVLSREKARREEAWALMEEAFKAEEKVMGTIFGRVKGGFTVDLDGVVAFLPGSQVDIRPIRDVTSLMGSPQKFLVLKMDRARGNIVVSRRAVLEETRAEERSELISNMSEGQVLEGVIKNITDYGAFVDLGGVDGLLHVTDISWKRITHPSEALQVGQSVNVQVIRFNSENQRISLGMKQLEADPWESVIEKYAIGTKLTGRVTNITDYGAFVELQEGIEGLVHVSEMSWTKKNVHPGKLVSTSQEVEVMVLDVDLPKRRISLGIKHCTPNPWLEFSERFKSGDEISGEIKNITEFGLFVGLTEEIDGMVHLSDLDWVKAGDEAINDFTKGENVKVKILEVDLDKERISLGVKQLTEDPIGGALDKIKKGDIVTCTVQKVGEAGLDVTVMGEVPGFIRRVDLSRDRSEQRPDRFGVGEVVDAKITSMDEVSRRVSLSIKAKEVEEEKIAMAEFGSSDSGASLGDILGAALKEKTEKGDSEAELVESKPDLPEPGLTAAGENPLTGTEENPKKTVTKKSTAKKKKTATKKKAASKKKSTSKKKSSSK